MKTSLPPTKADNASSDHLVAANLTTPASRTCSPFSTVTEAVLVFKDEDCNMVPVVDEGKPVGVVTDRDVALEVANHANLAELPVSEIMSRDLTSISRDAPFDQVIKTMIGEGAHTLFVVDANGLLEGVISWSDLAKRVPISVMTGVFDTDDAAEVDPL
jgi:predicted transcriptional regulator